MELIHSKTLSIKLKGQMKKMIDSIVFEIQRLYVLAAGGLVGGTAPTEGTTPPPLGGYGGAAPQQAAEAPQGLFSSPFMMIGLWVVIFVGFWMLMIRPQKNREKKLKELQSGIKAGDNIVTNSGLFGRVSDVGTDCFVVELGISGRTVKIPILKSDVLGIREPVLTPPPKENADS